jgi:hypothetical protein
MGTPLWVSLMLLAPLAARADQLPIPADAPAAFKAECGSCHLAFPPALLGSGDWQRVMARLDQHYGDNASLDEPVRRQLEAFLMRHAGSARKLGNAPGDPPRLTATGRFQRKHDEVASAVWKDPRVGSAANCAACHPRAEQGSYSERELTVPGMGGRRHGHD